MRKLTEAQRELLRVLKVSPRTDISNESVAKSLARKGLAERFVDRIGYLANRHGWRITPAGRSALASEGDGR